MKKRLIVFFTCILLVFSITGCGSSSDDSSTSSSGEALTVSMSGSTSMEDLVKLLSEKVKTNDPSLTLNGEFIGSSAGIEQLLAGNSDIGNASRNLSDDEKASGAVENIVCYDGIAIIENSANTTTNLTKDQLIAIYKGDIVNWSDVGGPDLAITVVGRESGSGTREAFESLLGIEDQCNLAQELDSNGAVISVVNRTEGAIGYASLNLVDDSTTIVNKLTLDGVEATEANIKSENYILFRPFVMATLGEIDTQNDAVKALFDYIQSDAGQEDISSLGLIPAE